MQLLAPFANRNFLRLFCAQVVSLLGTGLATIALALMVYDQYPSYASLILGAVLAVKMIAYLLVAPVVGAYVHHFPRRNWLAGLSVLRALIIAILPWVEQLWQLFVVVFLLNMMAAGFTPVYQALLPDLLNEEDYTSALSWSRLAMELESLLSPMLAAVCLLLMPYSMLFELNALAFGLAVLLILGSSLPPALPRQRSGGVWRQVSFGSRSYLHTPRLVSVLLLNLAMSAAGAMTIVNSVVYVRELLVLDESYLPWLMAALGAGSMLSALLLPSLLKFWPDRRMMLTGGWICGLAMLAGLLQPNYLALLLIWFVIGVANSMVLIPTARMVNSSCNPADRNDFFAANFALTHAMWLVCYLLAGSVTHVFGLSICFLVLALVALLATAIARGVWPDTDESELWHQHAAQHHQHPHIHDEHHQHEHEGWEGPEPHVHPHHHPQHRHRHPFVIDEHHLHWPRQS